MNLIVRMSAVWLLVACGERNIDLIESRDGKPCVICGKECVAVEENPKHCGGCGLKCAMGEQCCAGACTKVDADPANCGQCGTTCPVDGMCMGGKCSCPPMSVFCANACVMPGTVPECGSGGSAGDGGGDGFGAFACGSIQCNGAEEICRRMMSGTPGDSEQSSCEPYPEDCTTRDCSCFPGPACTCSGEAGSVELVCAAP